MFLYQTYYLLSLLSSRHLLSHCMQYGIRHIIPSLVIRHIVCNMLSNMLFHHLWSDILYAPFCCTPIMLYCYIRHIICMLSFFTTRHILFHRMQCVIRLIILSFAVRRIVHYIVLLHFHVLHQLCQIYWSLRICSAISHVIVDHTS